MRWRTMSEANRPLHVQCTSGRHLPSRGSETRLANFARYADCWRTWRDLWRHSFATVRAPSRHQAQCSLSQITLSGPRACRLNSLFLTFRNGFVDDFLGALQHPRAVLGVRQQVQLSRANAFECVLRDAIRAASLVEGLGERSLPGRSEFRSVIHVIAWRAGSIAIGRGQTRSNDSTDTPTSASISASSKCNVSDNETTPNFVTL